MPRVASSIPSQRTIHLSKYPALAAGLLLLVGLLITTMKTMNPCYASGGDTFA